MKNQKLYTQSLHCLASTNTIDYLWGSRLLQILLKKRLKRRFVVWIVNYSSMTLVFFEQLVEHMATLITVLQRLNDAGFAINPLKCEWAVKETDFLGFWLTPEGLKPWAKKVAGMVAMQEPTTRTQLQSFLGMIVYFSESK